MVNKCNQARLTDLGNTEMANRSLSNAAVSAFMSSRREPAIETTQKHKRLTTNDSVNQINNKLLVFAGNFH